MVALEEHATWLPILSLALLFIFSLLLIRPSKKTKLPPAPSKLPIIGNLHQLGMLPHRSLREFSLKHAPLMLLQLGRVPTLVVSSADMAQQVLKTQDLNFASRPQVSAAKKMVYNSKDIAFSPYGEYWRQMKKICVVELLNTKRVESFGFVRAEEVSNMMKTIYNSKAAQEAVIINMRELFVCFTNDIISRVALGKKYFGNYQGGDDAKISAHELMRDTSKLLGAFSVGDFFPSLGFLDVLTGIDGKQKKLFQRWDGFLEGVIQDHLNLNLMKDGHEHTDFLDVLLHVQKHSALDIPVTVNDIKAVIMDAITGGTETTSSTLEWAMTELVKHPEVMKKAQEEVRRVVGRKSKVDEVNIHQMVYLKSIVKETLRLHPSTPLLVPRECIKNTKIQGYDVIAKTMVYINVWAIGRDPTSWERAEEFEPERFINSKIDFKGQDFMLIPFGAGRRICPGISFAIPVMELALANLLHQFDWGLPKEVSTQDLDMAETCGITCSKKSPLFLVATPHLN